MRFELLWQLLNFKLKKTTKAHSTLWGILFLILETMPCSAVVCWMCKLKALKIVFNQIPLKWAFWDLLYMRPCTKLLLWTQECCFPGYKGMVTSSSFTLWKKFLLQLQTMQWKLSWVGKSSAKHTEGLWAVCRAVHRRACTGALSCPQDGSSTVAEHQWLHCAALPNVTSQRNKYWVF